jgi:hypothetical protein
VKRAAAASLVVPGAFLALAGAWIVLAALPRLGQAADTQTRGWAIMALILGALPLVTGGTLLAAGVGVIRERRWGRVLGLVASFVVGVVATLAATSQGWLLLLVALFGWFAFATLVALSRGETAG